MQFTIFIVSILGMFFWNRSESRADIRQMDAKLDSNRDLVHAIHLEMKDFHNRLCAIEEKTRSQRKFF